MLKEVYTLAALCNKKYANSLGAFHIVRYHQVWMEDKQLFIQTELCGSTLLDKVRNNVFSKSAPHWFKLLREILLALGVIHRNNMVHCESLLFPSSHPFWSYLWLTITIYNSKLKYYVSATNLTKGLVMPTCEHIIRNIKSLYANSFLPF